MLMFYFFLGIFFHSRVTGACPVTADLIMRVNVRNKNNLFMSTGRVGSGRVVTREIRVT